MYDDNFIIITMDNNKRGQQKRQEREGTSSLFIVVTYSMAIKSLKIPSIYPIVAPYHHKKTITYLDQAIVSVNGMSGCDNLHTIEDVISYITIDNIVNILVLRDYSGKRVNNQYDVAQICYGLIHQRQILLRNDKELKFVDKHSLKQVQPLTDIIYSNQIHTGLYENERFAQKKEVTQRFGDKNKVQFFLNDLRLQIMGVLLHSWRYQRFWFD